MGAFFTNIQLRLNLAQSELIDDVIEHITKFNNEAGFIRVENEDEADKTVIISPSDNLKWLSIYDEEMEGQGSKTLNKLASALSKEFNTTALSILVNDSDSMYMGLTIHGTLKDSISNLSNEIDFTKNKPSAWTEILDDKFSFDDIKKAWQDKTIFVEGFLTQFAKYTDLDNSKLLTGYEYINEEMPNEGIRLNFAQKDKKKTAELGLTKFSMLAGAALIDVKIGETQNLEWTLTNQGTFSYGLDVVVAGEGIEKGLLIPEIIKTNYIKSQMGKQSEFTANFVETVASTGERIFYARMEDIYIPKGFQPTYPMTAKEGKRYGKISYDSAIKFSIRFIGGNEGNGDLTIFFSPLVNRQNGSYAASIMKATLEDWINKNAL